jgi:hypothetical protein
MKSKEREYVNNYKREWYKKNRDREVLKQRNYNQTYAPMYRQKNRLKLLDYNRKRRQASIPIPFIPFIPTRIEITKNVLITF